MPCFKISLTDGILNAGLTVVLAAAVHRLGWYSRWRNAELFEDDVLLSHDPK
jgi:hypothetical protein